MDDFEIDDNSIKHNLILGTYFAFTTLSTVGFGDLYPKSNYERLFCALILLVGVGIFSVFLGDFTEILEAYKAIKKDPDDF
jgi:voltage-gated potassium channel